MGTTFTVALQLTPEYQHKVKHQGGISRSQISLNGACLFLNKSWKFEGMPEVSFWRMHMTWFLLASLISDPFPGFCPLPFYLLCSYPLPLYVCFLQHIIIIIVLSLSFLCGGLPPHNDNCPYEG
jgi:hypothetical protein